MMENVNPGCVVGDDRVRYYSIDGDGVCARNPSEQEEKRKFADDKQKRIKRLLKEEEE